MRKRSRRVWRRARRAARMAHLVAAMQKQRLRRGRLPEVQQPQGKAPRK